MLRAHEEPFWGSPDKVRVVNLLDHASEGRLQLQAVPTNRGKLATGITFTSFTGMGVITGISLTGIGCGSSDEFRSDMCKPGLITLLVSLPLLAGSIWLIVDSMPKAEVVPNDGGPTLFARRPSKPRLVWGPGFVSGTF
jgi:hypothetical protein